MAKTKKSSRTQKKESNSFFSKFNLEEILPQKYHVLAVILVIIILFLIFLNPLFFGDKTFQSGDIISSHSFANYIKDHKGGYTLWNPLIFCGMPAYAIGTGYKWFNLIWVGITTIKQIFISPFAVPYTVWTFYLILLGINTFFLMKYLTKNFLVSIFSSVATSFSTGIIVFLFIGHVTKLVALSMYPLIFLLMLRFEKKIKVIDFLLLIIAFQIMLQGFHVQIIFYTFFAIAIYYIYFILRGLLKKDNILIKNIVKSAGVLVLAGLIAGAIQLDNFSQIYQYMPYSTRGGKSIVENTSSSKIENESSSGYYKYHTDWSFSPQEVLTFIVPSFYGFGDVTYQGPLSQDQAVHVNTYFGQMPFVDVAMYMGVLIFFLALFAVFTCWKDPFVQFLTILAGIALLISFGRNLPILFNPMFNYFPYFNKFRVPSMILVLDQVTFPILAGLGIMRIINVRNDKDAKLIKFIRNTAFVFAGLFVVSLLLNSPISQWFISRVKDYSEGIRDQRLAQQFTALSDFMAGMFTGDLYFALGFTALTFITAFYYVNKRISKDSFVAIVIILTVIDLWRIDVRSEKYTDQPDINNMFKAPKYIQVIKDQKDKNPFRMINIKQDGSLGTASGNNGNYNAYFMVEDFYGYSAIKPLSYQDMMDVIGPVNPTLWRMLNVKYVVSSKPLPWPGFTELYKDKDEIVYRNNNALARAYFVNSVEQKPDLQVLEMVKQNSFDPKNIAFVNGEKLNVDVPDSSAYSNIVEYRDELVKLNVNASGNNFLFFGDTYIPTGWKAYIDGQKTKIYKTDHGFMGIVVPKDKHQIEFKYAPTSFYVSEYTALILSALVLLGLIISVYVEIKKNRKEMVEVKS